MVDRGDTHGWAAKIAAGVLPLVLGIFLMGGCGYQFPGGTDSRPKGIHRLHIPMVENSTTHTELTFTLTNAMVEQFTRSKALRLTSLDAAEAVLKTEITSVEILGAARDEDRTGSAARRVIVFVKAFLRRTDSGEKLWEGSAEGRRTYRVTDDQSTVEANLSLALADIAEEVAEKIHDALLQDF